MEGKKKNVFIAILGVTTVAAAGAAIYFGLKYNSLKIEASKIILIHNHPTGDPTPSKQDIEFTKNVEQASKILGIQLLDHIVIGDLKYVSIFSMREKQKEADEKGKK